jgi:2-polyprenyl-3-methyl-5-hydroxy-6-metoxy-1,4-benzoquinol methylase
LNAFEEFFSNLEGGKVLDVATGEGGYINILKRYLKSYTSISGVDSSEKVLAVAQRNHKDSAIQFAQMDAEQLGFSSGEFDIVNISGSLHHLENVTRVLGEMMRTLRPGGKFILTEMHRDGATTAQFNAIRIHHWAAGVDSSLGSLHDRTFARDEMLDFIDNLNLSNIQIRDFPNTDSDPMDDKAINSVGGYLDRYLQRAQKAPGGELLVQQGEELRDSLRENGLQREPVLLVLAEKP